MRLIDADAFFESFPELAIEPYINAPTVEPTFKPIAEVKFDKEQLQEIVDKARAEVLASVERPQGEWIFDRKFTEFGNPYGTYRCSVCGGHSSNKYSFCKDCGARMKPKTCTNCETFGQDCGDCEVGDDD